MYRFEIREEGADNGARYRWELLLCAGDGAEEVVAGSGAYQSRAEAETGIRAFRRGVARAEFHGEPRDHSGDRGPAVTFRRLPHVVSLPAVVPGRYQLQAPGQHRPHVPAPTEPRAEPPAAPAPTKPPQRRPGARTPRRGRGTTAKAT
jgi:uncharacterized protein YegP (UPF0339 family)